MADITVRMAGREDVSKILYFIRRLAEYEQMLDLVVADETTLEEQLFDKGRAEVLFVCVDGEPQGFALFFHNFSTFLGRAGIYLEDLYVEPEMRGIGCGKALLKALGKLALQRGCGRIEWWCLNWNRPSIDFYKSIGAEAMEEWTTFRITGDGINKLAEM